MRVAKRSSAIKVLGILNLVGGFLGLLGSLYALLVLVVGPAGFSPPNAANAANNPFDPVLMDAYMVAKSPGYHAFQYFGTSIGLILDVLMIVSGFGLLYYKEWARKMAIAYAAASLIFKVVTLVYQVFVMLPAMTSFFDQALSKAPPALAGMGGVMKASLYGGLIFSTAFGVYPIVVLCVLLSKSGKAAFGPPPEDDDDDDEEDYDDRRERFGDRPRRDDDRYGERDDRGGR
jgi:hypothetical protein